MLTITPQASEAIRGILNSENVPDGTLLRISPQADAGLVITLTEAPLPEDQIVKGDEVEICLEATAARQLDDRELDASVVGDQVNFRISEQA